MSVRSLLSSYRAVMWYLAVFLSGSFAIGLQAGEPTDIERNFMPVITRDLSGTYEVKEMAKDTSIFYTASMTLTYDKKFTTQRSSVFKTYRLTASYFDGETDSKATGLVVDDGTRIYYTSATGEPHKRNYLLLLGKLVLTDAQLASVMNYYESNKNAKDGQYFDWKDGSPWYGYVEPEDDVFGYLFHIGGTWAEFSLGKCGGFPLHMNDTGSYRILDLKENGEHRKRKQHEKGWYGAYLSDESDSWVAEPHGETIYLSSVRYYDKGKATWDYYGNGVMMAHPRTSDSLLFAMLGGNNSTHYGYVDEIAGVFEGVWSVIEAAEVGKVRWTRTETPIDEKKK